jgi:hypothetical protein
MLVSRTFAVVLALFLINGSAAPVPADRSPEEPEKSLLWGCNMVANPFILRHPEGYREDVYRKLAEMGSTMVRIVASPREVELIRGRRDWSDLDRHLELAEKYGIEPMVLIVNTPPWALPPEINTLPEGADPTYQYPYDEPYYPDWIDFNRELAERTKGRVHLFQVWNEANGFGWHTHDGFNHADEYFPMLTRAYDAIKGVNPEATVLLTSLDDAEGNGHYFLEMIYDLREASGRDQVFDGVTVHPYDMDLERKKEKLLRMHRLMAEHGDGDLPIYITEYGWRMPANDPRKSELVKETLELYQDPELHFLKGAIHLSLGDFRGEPGFGFTDENLREKNSYNAFQGAVRFGASPAYDFRVDGNMVRWKTRLPAISEVSRPGKRWRTSQGTEHEMPHLPVNGGPGHYVDYRVSTVTEDGRRWQGHPVKVWRMGSLLANGDFVHCWEAGVAEGWQFTGTGMATDAAVWPTTRIRQNHSQVLFGVPERDIPLDAQLSQTLIAAPANPGRAGYHVKSAKVSAREASFGDDVNVEARIGLEFLDVEFEVESQFWSDWTELYRFDSDLNIDVPAETRGSTVRLVLEVRQIGEASDGARPAAAFDDAVLTYEPHLEPDTNF